MTGTGRPSARFLRAGLVAGLYFGTGYLGLLLDTAGPNSTLYWPAAGLAVGALVRLGRATWPAIFAGAALVGLCSGLPIGQSLVIGLGNALGPLAVVIALERLGFDRRLSRRRDVGIFATAVPVLMWIPAVIGIGTLAWGGIPVGAVGTSILEWWLGDVLGTLTVAPLLLSADRRLRGALAGRGVEIGTLVVATIGLNYAVWVGEGNLPAFVSLLTLAWAAARFDAPIPPLIVTITAGFAAVGTAAGAGPYAAFVADDRTGPLVSFLVTVAVLNLLIGALLAERTEADLSRVRSEEQLASAVADIRSVNALLAGIHAVQTSFIADADPRQAFGRLLPVLLDQTESEYGFIAEVTTDDHGKPFLTAHAITDIAPDGTPDPGGAAPVRSDIVFTNLDTLFGAVVRSREPVIANDSRNDLGRGGIPPWHRPLNAFLGIPLLIGTELVGVVGVANRRDGYDQGVIDRAQPLLSTCASLILAIRTERSRRAVTAALTTSEQRMRGIIDSASDAIITADHQHRIVVFNRAAELMFGVAAAEAIGEPVDRFISARGRDTGRSPAPAEEPALAPGGAARVHGCRADGREFPVEASISQVGPSDRGLYTLILRDVSERIEAEATRQRLEHQLRESQKLEAIGTLAGGIAHDFNNILGAIMGNAEVAAGDLPAGHPAGRALEQIDAASRRARDLVRQILAFTRRQEASRRPVGLRGVVQEVVGMIRASLPASVEIRTELPDGVAAVNADPTELHQVVMNLCANAAQAMPGGGVLEIRVDRVHLDDSAPMVHPDLTPGGYLRLTVRDTGVGMDDVTRARIFEPFFTTKPPGQGTGLGLAVVHGIVTSYRGAVTVATAPAAGSTFAVYLPLSRAPERGEAIGAPLPRGQGERILLVDDEPALISVGRTLLGRLGYQVTGYTSPIAALEAIRAAPDQYDLVITDLTMPVLSGIELAKLIQPVRPDLPIVVATGYGRVLTAADLAEARIRDVIDKPATLEVMAATVRRALDGARLPDRPRLS